MVDVIEPSSELQNAALILAIIFCFVLILLAVWFSTQHSIGSAFFSMTGAVFLVLVVWSIKGVFRK